MSTVAATSTDVVAARVQAWLRVGGSWTAIATAHDATDVDAFKRQVIPHLDRDPTATAAAAPPVRPVQLRLFVVH